MPLVRTVLPFVPLKFPSQKQKTINKKKTQTQKSTKTQRKKRKEKKKRENPSSKRNDCTSREFKRRAWPRTPAPEGAEGRKSGCLPASQLRVGPAHPRGPSVGRWGLQVLGHPPGTLDPRTNTGAAKASLLQDGHYQRAVARAQRGPRGGRPAPGPQAAQPSFAGGRARCWGRLPAGPAVLGARGSGRCLSGPRGGHRRPPPPAPGACRGAGGLPGALPPRGATSVGAGRRRGAPTPAWDPGAAAPRPKRQPALALGRERRRPRAAGRGDPQGSGRLRRRRPKARAGGSRGRRGSDGACPRRSRRTCGAGGEARGPSPCKAARSRPAPAAAASRAPPQPRTPRAASPFRARHAAAILFTSRPRPAPPRRRTPAAGPTPPAADVPARWLSRKAPPRDPTRRRCRLGRLDPGRRPSGDWFALGPAPGVATAGLIGPPRRPSRGGGVWREAGAGRRARGVDLGGARGWGRSRERQRPPGNGCGAGGALVGRGTRLGAPQPRPPSRRGQGSKRSPRPRAPASLHGGVVSSTPALGVEMTSKINGSQRSPERPIPGHECEGLTKPGSPAPVPRVTFLLRNSVTILPEQTAGLV